MGGDLPPPYSAVDGGMEGFMLKTRAGATGRAIQVGTASLQLKADSPWAMSTITKLRMSGEKGLAKLIRCELVAND